MTNKRYAVSNIPWDDHSDECITSKPSVVHPTHVSTVEEALRIGHELTRDYVADFFKVIDITVDRDALPPSLRHLIP